MLLVLFCLALAAAGSPSATPVDEEVFALIEAGEIARAAELAQALIDREAAGPSALPAAIADHLQRFAERFYGGGTKESVDVALRLYERALTLRQAGAETAPAPLADLLHDLSSVYFNIGEYDRSEQAERQALAIRERLYSPGDARAAESRRDLGLVFLAQGKLQEASSHLLEALRALEAFSPRDQEQWAAGRNYLAELYRLQGRYDEAALVLEQLVREAPEAGPARDPQFPSFLNNLAGVYRDQGRFDEAETLLRRSLALRTSASPREDADVAVATLNIGELYRAQGKLSEAEPLYAEALRLARSALGPGSPMLFEYINQSAVLFREQGRLDEAEPRFREALALVEEALGPDHPRAGQSRLDLAELLRLRGRCDEAEVHYRQAARIRGGALGPRHPDVAEAMTALAGCLAPSSARRDAARESLDEAIGILEGTEAHPAVAAQALALRADLRRGGDPAGARSDLLEALRVVESMRPHRGGGEGVRAEFFGRYAALYERMVRWEIEEGQPERAIEIAERGRARALLDQLAAAHVGQSASLPPELAGRQAAARAELAEIRQRMTFEAQRTDLKPQERLTRVEALEMRLEASTRSFRALYDEARNANPAWRGARAGEPPEAGELQRAVVPDDGLMLLYQLGAEGSFVFAVPPAPGRIEAKPLVLGPGDAAALGARAGPLTEASLGGILLGGFSPGLLSRLSSPQGSPSRGIGGLSAGPDPDVARLHALWRVLVPPALRARVQRAREVLVVPDGSLFLLPFETLVMQPGHDLAATRFWLDEGPALRYAPSATFVHELSRRAGTQAAPRAGAAALSVSDPAYGLAGSRPASATLRGADPAAGRILARLPGTARETDAVRAALGPMLDVAVLQGPEARESAVRKQVAGRRYLHIATHGLVDLQKGELFAALALAPQPSGALTGDDDGLLQLFEIYDLRLDAELAVLSACSSNTGRVVTGEGVFALSRGFLVAGARRVIASQWSVDDASTAELVGALFRRIAASEKTGRPIDFARALRDARLAIRREARWAHPFFWGPFVLTGLE